MPGAGGWHEDQIRQCPSPNYGPRRGALRPRFVVLHATCMDSHDAALARLCDPAAEVSAHYLIAEAGTVTSLVPEAMRAWHAGVGGWQGVTDMNSASIGIELANTGAAPFPAPQIAALEALLAVIRARWGIAPEGVIAHSDMAPGRKADPGPRFDWRALARSGHAIWPDAPGSADVPLAESLARIGYPPVEAAARLAAFRLRFRPQAQGPETGADRAMAAAVAAVVTAA